MLRIFRQWRYMTRHEKREALETAAYTVGAVFCFGGIGAILAWRG